MWLCGDLRLVFLTVACCTLLLDVLAAKPLAVPFFALRRHQSSMKHSFGPMPQTGTDVFGSAFLTSGMRAGRAKPIPSYSGSLVEDDESQMGADYVPISTVTLPPPPALVAVAHQNPSKIHKETPNSYQASSPSRSLIDRIEHPVAAHRFKMNPECLMDPPIKARFARSVDPKPVVFYSFNPAGQQCDKLIIDENIFTPGPNVYVTKSECQLDCCPTALCLRM